VTSKVTSDLMVFADGDVHTLTEIAPPGPADVDRHRLASELVAWRFSNAPRKPYRIGLRCECIASELPPSRVRSLLNHTDRDAGPTVLHELSRATRSECRLGILRGSEV